MLISEFERIANMDPTEECDDDNIKLFMKSIQSNSEYCQEFVYDDFRTLFLLVSGLVCELDRLKFKETESGIGILPREKLKYYILDPEWNSSAIRGVEYLITDLLTTGSVVATCYGHEVIWYNVVFECNLLRQEYGEEDIDDMFFITYDDDFPVHVTLALIEKGNFISESEDYVQPQNWWESYL